MAKYRFLVKSPDAARELFRDWKNGLGTPQKREDTYLSSGEYFWLELDTETQQFRLMKNSER